MGKQFLRYGFGAIALYLVVNNFTGAGQVFAAGSKGIVDVTKGFQGRN